MKPKDNYKQAMETFLKGQHETAYPALLRFAEQGHPEAQCILGNYYELGLGRPVDVKEARKWYLKSSNQGYGVASNNLGSICSQQGDLKQAETWYKKARQQGFKHSPKGSKQKTVTTDFRNVDVDLCAASGMDELLEALKPGMMVISRDGQRASLELADIQPQSAEEAILCIVKIIQALPPQARALWKQCKLLSLNIGIHAGTQSHEAYFTLSAKTVKLVASVGAEIVFTVYG